MELHISAALYFHYSKIYMHIYQYVFLTVSIVIFKEFGILFAYIIFYIKRIEISWIFYDAIRLLIYLKLNIRFLSHIYETVNCLNCRKSKWQYVNTCTCAAKYLFTQMYESHLIYQFSITRWLEYCRNMPETLGSSCSWLFTTCDIEKKYYLLCIFIQATIARNAKDTAHTKAERNILECVKVILI